MDAPPKSMEQPALERAKQTVDTPIGAQQANNADSSQSSTNLDVNSTVAVSTAAASSSWLPSLWMWHVNFLPTTRTAAPGRLSATVAASSAAAPMTPSATTATTAAVPHSATAWSPLPSALPFLGWSGLMNSPSTGNGTTAGSNSNHWLSMEWRHWPFRRAMEAEHRLLMSHLTCLDLARSTRFHPMAAAATSPTLAASSVPPVLGAQIVPSSPSPALEPSDDHSMAASVGVRAWTDLVCVDGDQPTDPRSGCGRHAGRFINTLFLDTRAESASDLSLGVSDNNLVITHGYGAGLGMWFRNYVGLASRPEWGYRIFSIDWLGMGRSSRVPLPPKDPTADTEADIDKVEDYFVESLEAWRKACGIEQMILMGHSFGGYMSCRYAIRYPERVKHLILVSPVGVPPKPDDIFPSHFSANTRRLLTVAGTLWEWNVTPQAAVRTMGPFGKQIVQGFVQRRFAHVDVDADVLTQYLYSISSLDGSGEFALNRILSPGAWARRPLASALSQLAMPVTFLYGEYDWMSPAIPMQLVRQGLLKEGSRVVTVPDAGHQLFVENYNYFNRAILQVMERVQSSGV